MHLVGSLPGIVLRGSLAASKYDAALVLVNRFVECFSSGQDRLFTEECYHFSVGDVDREHGENVAELRLSCVAE